MTLAALVSTLTGVFKFWDQVTWLVKTLEGTPEQHREAIMAQVQANLNEAIITGRPV